LLSEKNTGKLQAACQLLEILNKSILHNRKIFTDYQGPTASLTTNH